jgi:ankyrin repeat protein
MNSFLPDQRTTGAAGKELMMTIHRTLPPNPDLDQLKRQAKELLEAFVAGKPEAVAEVNAWYRRADPASFALHDAQLVMARAHGFDSWPKLKAHVDGVTIQRLVDAVKSGTVAEVRAMLKTRPELANMTVTYGDEHRAIHYAVYARNPELVRLLMQHGADARAGIHPHRDATAALTIAAERGYDEIVAIIHAEEQQRTEIPVNAQDTWSEWIAAGDEERAIAAMEAEPSLISVTDREGWTPLHIAAAVLNRRLVSWLIEHGADVNRPGKLGRTPLDMAASSRRTGDFEAIAALLRHHGASLTPRAAVALGDAEWLRARHAEGTLVNPIEWSSGGLLTVAVRRDRPEMLTLLLDFGFDPNERVRSDESGSPAFSQAFPLWHAVAAGKRHMAEILLRRGAEPNAHVDSSGSSMYSAFSHRQWEMAELLRQHGGTVSADIAAIYRRTDLAREVLAAGDPDGNVAQELLRFAADGGAPEIVSMALERIDWPRDDSRWFGMLSQPLSFWNHIPWLYAGNKEFDRSTYLTCFRLILERCDPNVRGGFGRTVLHEVGAMGDHITDEEAAPFATALLDAGARTDVRDELLQSTPLGWACRWGRTSVAKVLLDRGADPVENGAEPWATPRAWAEKMGHRAIAALLTMP